MWKTKSQKLSCRAPLCGGRLSRHYFCVFFGGFDLSILRTDLALKRKPEHDIIILSLAPFFFIKQAGDPFCCKVGLTRFFNLLNSLLSDTTPQLYYQGYTVVLFLVAGQATHLSTPQCCFFSGGFRGLKQFMLGLDRNQRPDINYFVE